MSNFDGDMRLNEREAGAYLAASVAFMRKNRLLKTGPSYIKVGRLVRYELQDLRAFLAANKVETAA